jgi:hypothetical protein
MFILELVVVHLWIVIVIIPINLPFNGDLIVHITHAAIGHSRQIHVNFFFAIENLFFKKIKFNFRREEFVYVN